MIEDVVVLFLIQMSQKCEASWKWNYEMIMRFQMNNDIWKHAERLIWDIYMYIYIYSHTHFGDHLMFDDKYTLASVHHENHDECKCLMWMWHPVRFLFILQDCTVRITLLSLVGNYTVRIVSSSTEPKYHHLAQEHTGCVGWKWWL